MVLAGGAGRDGGIGVRSEGKDGMMTGPGKSLVPLAGEVGSGWIPGLDKVGEGACRVGWGERAKVGG